MVFSLKIQEIPVSPFRVKVDPSHDASKVKAEGPGLARAGLSLDWLINGLFSSRIWV